MLDGLASLVEKSLVQVEGRSAEEVRYRLLESAREYALEQLRLRNELEEARRISLIITTKRLGQFFWGDGKASDRRTSTGDARGSCALRGCIRQIW